MMKNIKSSFHLFHEALIRCEIYDKDGIIGEYQYKAEYVFLELLSDLYSKYKNWTLLKTWWVRKNTPIGYLENNDQTKSLIDKKIEKTDWNYFHKNDFNLIATVSLKDSDKLIRYDIKRSDLVSRFITLLYDTYDDNWKSFKTYYADTKNPAFSLIENTKYRKKTKRISPTTLASLMLIEKMKNKELPPIVFYLLYFQNRPFIKIGLTTNLKYRLFNYLYPQSDSELYFYENAEIDFTKSIIVISDEAKKIEIQMKQHFKSNLTYIKEKESDFNSLEILNKDCYNSLLFELKEYNKKYLVSMLGYNKSSQLKSVLEALGVIKNASHVLTNKKPYLPFDIKY